MFKKIILLTSLLMLTACSIDAVKPTITNGLKSILQKFLHCLFWGEKKGSAEALPFS